MEQFIMHSEVCENGVSIALKYTYMYIEESHG